VCGGRRCRGRCHRRRRCDSRASAQPTCRKEGSGLPGLVPARSGAPAADRTPCTSARGARGHRKSRVRTQPHAPVRRAVSDHRAAGRGDVIRTRLLHLPAAEKEAVLLTWSPPAAPFQCCKHKNQQNPMHLYAGRSRSWAVLPRSIERLGDPVASPALCSSYLPDRKTQLPWLAPPWPGPAHHRDRNRIGPHAPVRRRSWRAVGPDFGQNPMHLHALQSRPAGRAGAGPVERSGGRVDSRIPRASYLSERRRRLSWLGATGRAWHTVRPDDGQNPMHQCHPRARSA
jgi:hypothetical protein